MAVTIKGSGQVVVQIVQGTYGTQSSTSSTSYVDTGLSASITPTSASNKVLIFINIPDVYNNDAQNRIYLNIVRSSTQIVEFVKHGNYRGGGQGLVTFGGATSYLDTPATTSATTYKVQIKTNTSSAFWCFDNSTATITLMEISG